MADDDCAQRVPSADPRSDGDVAAMGKVGTAVACVGTLVALGPAAPNRPQGAPFAQPAAAASRAARSSPVDVGRGLPPVVGRLDTTGPNPRLLSSAARRAP